MSRATLLDASAVLAFLQGEPGSDVVQLALQSGDCLVSAANHAEVIAKSLDRGLNAETMKAILADLTYTVIDIKADDGAQAGWMRGHTSSLGLSLGDRLCLAVAQRLNARLLTADRPWLTVAGPLNIEIRCIRPDAH